MSDFQRDQSSTNQPRKQQSQCERTGKKSYQGFRLGTGQGLKERTSATERRVSAQRCILRCAAMPGVKTVVRDNRTFI